MRPHEGVERPHGAELAPLVLRRPFEHRALAVHHLVVADRQHEVLRVRVRHGERHLVVVVLAVDRLAPVVAQRVVHPAHVPLEAETETPVVDGPGHPGPGGRLLGDHHDAGLASVVVLVDPLQQLDGLEVLVAAVLVRHPLPGLTGVVQVEHRGDGVDPQAVDVELVQPVVGVGDQERLHLVAAEVEDVGAPVRVPAQSWVLVLVERRTVEALQGPRIGREVTGHPVDQDADAGLVQLVDQVAELVGGAEPGDRREVAGDVVAPRPVVGVLGDRHELDVGEALPGHVLHQLAGQLDVGQSLAPGAQVHLVDADRLLVLLLLPPEPQPLLVVPGVPRLVDDGGVVRRRFAEAGERVGFQPPHPVPAEHLELVERTGADTLDEQRPDPRPRHQVHGRGLAVPVVEVADQPDRLGVGGPDREPGTGDLSPLGVGDADLVRAQPAPGLGVMSFVEPGQVPSGQLTAGVECHRVLLLSSSALVVGESADRAQRDRRPVRTVAYLVDELVDGLVRLVRPQDRPLRCAFSGPSAYAVRKASRAAASQRAAPGPGTVAAA